MERMAPRLVTPLPIVTLVRLVHSWNAFSSMVVTLSGCDVGQAEARLEACGPMLVTLLGIVTQPSCAEMEHLSTNVCDTIADGDTGQVAAELERIVPMLVILSGSSRWSVWCIARTPTPDVLTPFGS